jgi:hypothetical protein
MEIYMTSKLDALKKRLIDAQRALIIQAAESETLPSDNALRKIADLEVAIGAVEALTDES